MNINLIYLKKLHPYYIQRIREQIVDAVVMFACMVGILLIIVCAAFAETASYYTYESCRREGTSGIYTTSGERFDENDLTAAMWGVKFGTKIKVTNLENGKSVIVRINDRGPAKKLVSKGRIIDLSKAAFIKIADLKKGVIRVKVEEVRGA